MFRYNFLDLPSLRPPTTETMIGAPSPTIWSQSFFFLALILRQPGRFAPSLPNDPRPFDPFRESVASFGRILGVKCYFSRHPRHAACHRASSGLAFLWADRPDPPRAQRLCTVPGLIRLLNGGSPRSSEERRTFRIKTSPSPPSTVCRSLRFLAWCIMGGFTSSKAGWICLTSPFPMTKPSLRHWRPSWCRAGDHLRVAGMDCSGSSAWLRQDGDWSKRNLRGHCDVPGIYDENGWKWMNLDETGWTWMKMDEIYHTIYVYIILVLLSIRAVRRNPLMSGDRHPGDQTAWVPAWDLLKPNPGSEWTTQTVTDKTF